MPLIIKKLRTLCIDIPLVALDNHLLGRRVIPYLVRPAILDQQIRADTPKNDAGVDTKTDAKADMRKKPIHHTDVLIDFTTDPEQNISTESSIKMNNYLSEKGRVSGLPRLRSATEKDALSADQKHTEPVFLIGRLSFHNPTLLLNQIAILLLYAESIYPGKTVSLWIARPQDSPLAEIVEKLFHVQHMHNARGIHYFSNLHKFTGPFLNRRVLPYQTAPLRQKILKALDIVPRQPNSEVRKILLISRQDYQISITHRNFLARKVANEQEIVSALRHSFPDMDVQAVRLETLTAREQVQQIHQSDIVVAMHGAALAFVALMAKNTALLELFPCHFAYPHYYKSFYNLSACNGSHYRRWINFFPWREYNSPEWTEYLETNLQNGPTPEDWLSEPKRDFSRVPPMAVVRKIKSLQRCIHKSA